MADNIVDCRDCAGYSEDHPAKCRLWLKRTNSNSVENCPGFIDKSTFERIIRERYLNGGFLVCDLAIDTKEKPLDDSRWPIKRR